MKDQKYYFITVFTKLEIDDLGWPVYGDSRCWGFYTDKEKAFQAVHENWTDMEETIYHYALIEEYEEGIAHCNLFWRQWFEFDVDKNGYVEMDEPKGFEHFKSLAIG